MARSDSKLLNVLRKDDKRTEKGMSTNSTSLNGCVDLFFMAGSTRHWSKEEKIEIFQKAFNEDPLIALKILFWARDIREGAGERDFFRDIITYLNVKHPDIVKNNAHLIPEFGRWDDVFYLDDNISLPLIEEGIKDGDYLLGKWLPRKKQYDNFASKVRNHLKLSPKEYRKLIVSLSDTVEQKMCSKMFKDIEYNKVPSMAMNKYRKSFYRNDEERFKKFIEDVQTGESKINAGAIYPHLLYRALNKNGRADLGTFKVEEDKAIEAQWNSLPNFMENSKHRILPMVDVSPSMTWNNGLPLEVSISLGIYISERNKSIFKDAFMTFSDKPTIQYLKGSFADKVYQLRFAKWGATTNLEIAFETLLNKSVEYDVDENEMPTMILIISDMQFDQADQVDDNALKMIEKKYKKHGYNMPQIIFWNVRSENDNVPAEDNKKGVGLVSGFSPSLLKEVLKGDIKKKPTPMETMLKIIESERYNSIMI